MGTVELITILATTLFLLQVIWLTAKNKLTDKQAFIWLIFAIGGVIVAFGLPFLNEIAAKLGISYMPSLIFMVTFFLVLSLLIYHTIIISRQEKHIKYLVQEVGYLGKEIEDIQKLMENKMKV
ncbi:MAG: DUF2304 domain-containing protein [Paenisporosarcina sp.]